MKVKVQLPPPVDPAEFLALLQLLKIVAGDNLQEVAEALGVSRSTIYRWFERKDPPDNWWWRLVLQKTIDTYEHYHTNIVKNHRPSWRTDASRTILKKLRQRTSTPVAFGSVSLADLPESPKLTVQLLYSDGKEPHDFTDLSIQRTREEADLAYEVRRQLAVRRILVWDDEKIIWSWRPGQDYIPPFATITHPIEEPDMDD